MTTYEEFRLAFIACCLLMVACGVVIGFILAQSWHTYRSVTPYKRVVQAARRAHQEIDDVFNEGTKKMTDLAAQSRGSVVD